MAAECRASRMPAIMRALPSPLQKTAMQMDIHPGMALISTATICAEGMVEPDTFANTFTMPRGEKNMIAAISRLFDRAIDREAMRCFLSGYGNDTKPSTDTVREMPPLTAPMKKPSSQQR